MRWKAYEPEQHEYGTLRIVKRFLWLPVRFGYETRWLERAGIVQQWTKHGKFIEDVSGAGGSWLDCWRDVAFAERTSTGDWMIPVNAATITK